MVSNITPEQAKVLGISNPHVPVLDDGDIPTDEQVAYGGDQYIWSDDVDEPANDAETARYWAAKHGEALSDLSAARFQRDIWSVFGFAIGVVCGAGLAALVVML